MKRFAGIFFSVIVVLTACQPDASPTERPPDPEAMLVETIQNIREIDTFRVILEQKGADYPFTVTLDGETSVSALLQRGEGQFVAPNVLYANVKLKIGLPITMDLFARGSNQWFIPPGLSNWINYPFAEDFDPGALMDEEGGFQAALQSLTEVTYVAAEDLVDGTPIHHLRGMAGGQVVTDLLFGLLEPEGDVMVDVYIARETRLPALLIVTMVDTATEEEPENTQWSIEIFDFNAPAEINDPEATPND